MNQVRHVFIGEVIKDAFKAQKDPSKITQRNALLFINPDVSRDESVIPFNQAAMSAVPRFQVAMFQNPLGSDGQLIISPIIEKTGVRSRFDISPVSFQKEADAPLDLLCDIQIGNLIDCRRLTRGQTLVLRIRFTNIFDLSPGQKYFDLSYQLKIDEPVTSANDIEDYVTLISNKFVSMLNNNKYLSKFLVADTVVMSSHAAGASVVLHIKAKDLTYDSYQRYPNRLINFDACLVYDDNQPIFAPTASGSDALTVTKIGPQYSGKDPNNVMDAEKTAQGYRGVTNITHFPVTTPALRTNLQRKYNGTVINLEREYHDPANLKFYSNESVEMYFQTLTDADIASDWADGYTNIIGILNGIRAGVAS